MHLVGLGATSIIFDTTTDSVLLITVLWFMVINTVNAVFILCQKLDSLKRITEMSELFTVYRTTPPTRVFLVQRTPKLLYQGLPSGLLLSSTSSTFATSATISVLFGTVRTYWLDVTKLSTPIAALFFNISKVGLRASFVRLRGCHNHLFPDYPLTLHPLHKRSKRLQLQCIILMGQKFVPPFNSDPRELLHD